jgi:hypothetical protein
LTQIRKVELRSFRGVPGELALDLTSPSGLPASLLLLGDNGAGKSTIVDALEFALQGNLAFAGPQGRHRPAAKSYATNSLPSVAVTLDDGNIVRRSMVKDEQGILLDFKEPHRAFSVSPFILRRADILRFLDAPESERVLVFWNYLRSPSTEAWSTDPRTQLDNLKEERLQAKTARDESRSEFASALGVSVADIPFEEKEFWEFVKNRVYGGLSETELSKMGKRLRVNTKAQQLLARVAQTTNDYRRIKGRVNQFTVHADPSSFPTHLIPAMNAFLAGMAPRLTDAFRDASGLPFIERVDLDFGGIGALVLDVTLVLKNGRTCAPRQILSEANQDLLALLFFVALAEESAVRGQARLLVFDDVLQSVDATIRVSATDQLLRRLHEWQLVFTTHDRLWYSQLRSLLLRHGHPFVERQLARWTFEDGPSITGSQLSVDAPLRTALLTGTPATICSESGLLLEAIADALSQRLPTSVTRRRDDRYTLGDLWPGVYKILRRTSAEGAATRVDTWLHLRNLMGAHFNEWSLGLSLSEAGSFGTAVLELLPLARCVDCQSWVEAASTGSRRWDCRCGKTWLDARPEAQVPTS